MMKDSPMKQVERKTRKKRPSYSHYRRKGTLKALKQVNPVIQGAKLIKKETSKATVKGLKKDQKRIQSHVGVRKI